jgi:hypothetical protein
MLKILIERDAATRVPKEVEDLAAARAYESMGFSVHLQNDDGTSSPLPADAPAEVAAPEPAPSPAAAPKAAPAKKVAAKKKR